MPVTISLPDEILEDDAHNLPRAILEQVALDGFKSGQLTTSQVRRILGFETRMQVHEFLAAHGVPWVDYSVEELERERNTLKELIAHLATDH
jgi:predicted HTH domain antitoxin